MEDEWWKSVLAAVVVLLQHWRVAMALLQVQGCANDAIRLLQRGVPWRKKQATGEVLLAIVAET